MNSLSNLTPQQLRQAADLQEQILALQQERDQLLGGGPGNVDSGPRRKRRLSAQGLANIRAGVRKRRAKGHTEDGRAEVGRKRRHRMSAAGRARIATALRKRWAAAKRAGRNTL